MYADLLTRPRWLDVWCAEQRPAGGDLLFAEFVITASGREWR
jgi:hypothetical protein